MAMHQHGRVPEEMYEWQAECLSQQQGSVLEGETNLVFAAPTSAGKTLVAEILMLRALSRDPKRKTLLVLPYVALCREKAERLQSLVAPLDRQVREAHGGSASKRTGILAPSTGIIVATIENANSLINRLLESSVKLSDEFSCVVVDELHMLGDGDRGYLLELLLNKFLYQEALGLRESLNDNASPAYPSFSSIKGCTEAGTLEMSNLSFSFLHQTASVQPNRKVQLVGMSATLPNLETIAHWLSAACYQTTFRPVPLYEYIKCENELLCLDSKTQELCIARKLPPPSYQGDDEHITELVKEVSDAGHSCLVFCATKKSCEVEATRLARQLGNVEEGEDNSGEGKGGSEVTEIEEWVAEL